MLDLISVKRGVAGCVLCLGLLGCGPSAQDERAYRDFYASVDEVWDLTATGTGKDGPKLQKAIGRAEEASAAFKAISPRTRKAINDREPTIHNNSRDKYKKLLSQLGPLYLDANPKMSDLLVDAFDVRAPKATIVSSSVLFAYSEAYKK